MTPEVAIIELWVAWLVSWGIAAFWSSRTEKRGNIPAEIVFRILFWISGALLFVPFEGRPYFVQMQLWHLNLSTKWICVALAAAGFGFVWWARVHLGRLWSDSATTKAGHHVVDSGPYRLVRHPIYTGLIFAALATAVQKGTSYALLGAILFALAFYMRARGEERFLRLQLGESAYDPYARKTPMLLPFIGRTPK